MDKEYDYKLFVGGKVFLSGDKNSIGMIFANLVGRNFAGKEPSPYSNTYEQWRAMMEVHFEQALPLGQACSMVDPNGRLMEKSRIGACVHGSAQNA